MNRKPAIILAFLLSWVHFSSFATVPAPVLKNTPSSQNHSPLTPEPLDADLRRALDQAFKQSDILQALEPLLQPQKMKFEKKLGNLGQCNDYAKTRSWLEWRNSQEPCGEKKNPDEFRRYVIGALERTVTHILEKTGVVETILTHKAKSIDWLAIGTPGPSSDIDTVARDVGKQGEKYLPKIVAEVRAKSLFDALGLVLYGKPTGVAFDTESYIDVTDDLTKQSYEARIQKPLYKNLAITLAFTQVARQLHHGINLYNGKSHSLYTYNDFETQFAESKFIDILRDAHGFSEITFPAPDPAENIRKYLPIINYLAVKSATLPDELERAKIKGILATYFPESYFARESLAHVCYSDDRYSQLLLKLITSYWHTHTKEKSGGIPPDVIENLKGQTITPNPFIYSVSALENLGYFFHKLDKEKRPYEALKNASKYFFRVARAFAGYWKVKEEDIDHSSKPDKEKSQEERYVANLYQIASKLERLKRGFLPFSSPLYIESLLKGVRKSLNDAQIKEYANTLYALYSNIYMSQDDKLNSLKSMETVFQGLIKYDEQLKRFDLSEPSKNAPVVPIMRKKNMSAKNIKMGQQINQTIQDKSKASILELVSLMNLIVGIDNDSKNMKLQKIRKDSELQGLEAPTWNLARLNTLGNLTDVEFKAFLNDLVLFMRHTLEDFSQKNNVHQPIGLKQFAAQQIKAAMTPRQNQVPLK
jgi:hypothetical protein